MAQSPLPGNVALPVDPLEPSDVERWFNALSRGLALLSDQVAVGLASGASVAGFEFLSEEEANALLAEHLEEAEWAAIFQLLACAEGQLNRKQENAGPLAQLMKRKAAAKGLGSIVGSFKKVAVAGSDLSSLENLYAWSGWRDWYGHGRRYEDDGPPSALSVATVASTVRTAIDAAQVILDNKAAQLGLP